MTIDIINDRIGGTTSVYFSSETITTPMGCDVLSDGFLYGSSITIHFFSDQSIYKSGIW